MPPQRSPWPSAHRVFLPVPLLYSCFRKLSNQPTRYDQSRSLRVRVLHDQVRLVTRLDHREVAQFARVVALTIDLRARFQGASPDEVALNRPACRHLDVDVDKNSEIPQVV